MISFALPILLAVSPLAQTALSDADVKDGRCLAIFSLLIERADADTGPNASKAATGARLGFSYFLGKLDGRVSADLETVMRSVEPYVDSHLNEEQQRCIDEFGSAAQRAMGVGANLKKAPTPRTP